MPTSEVAGKQKKAPKTPNNFRMAFEGFVFFHFLLSKIKKKVGLKFGQTRPLNHPLGLKVPVLPVGVTKTRSGWSFFCDDLNHINDGL